MHDTSAELPDGFADMLLLVEAALGEREAPERRSIARVQVAHPRRWRRQLV